VHKQLSVLPFRIENVRPSKSLEFFLSTQHWMDAFPPPRDAHYARLCSHLKTLLNLAAGQAASAVPERSSTPALDPARLQHIERQLAGYIGPLAKRLVKAAASRATGIDDLIGRLSMELDTDAERREFTQRCRVS
jgi:hypothetical protein